MNAPDFTLDVPASFAASAGSGNPGLEPTVERTSDVVRSGVGGDSKTQGDSLTHLDLFSGIGGFAIAAKMAGFLTIGFCEKDPYAQQLLKEKFGAVLADSERNGQHGTEKRRGTFWRDVKRRVPQLEGRCSAPPSLHADIRGLNGKQFRGVTVLTGGFPCQPFSVAGKRRGAEDDRALWPEMLRIIGEARPAWVLGENVPGIIGMELDNCIAGLEAAGYSAWPLVIPACAVDAQHRRDRVWIVAHSADAERDGRWNRIGRRSAGESDTDRAGEEGSVRWEPEPGMGRVADGVSNRSHRLKGLGNAIVPQVAFQILRGIAAMNAGGGGAELGANVIERESESGAGSQNKEISHKSDAYPAHLSEKQH